MKYLPLIATELFLGFTIVLFAFIQWPIDNAPTLYTYLLLAHLACIIGYVVGVNFTPRTCAAFPSWKALFIAGIVITLVLFLPNLYASTGGTMNIILGLTNPGDAYNQSRYLTGLGFGNDRFSRYVGQAGLVFGYFIWCVLPLGVMFWDRLSFKLKMLFLLTCLARLIESACIGVNKGVADILLLLPWLLIIKDRVSGRRKRMTFAKLVGYAVVLIALGTIFLNYFNSNIEERTGRAEYRFSTRSGEEVLTIGEEAFAPLPLPIRRVMVPVTAYLTQGYYSLSLCFKVPFEWTYGIGHTRPIAQYVEKYVSGVDSVRVKTYAYRLDTGFDWDEYLHWHSAYPWIAGDVTFAGSLVVMALFGALLAMTWRDIMDKQNYCATCLFIYLILTVFYMSANPQIFQFSESVLGFYIALLVWLFTRTKKGALEVPGK